MTLLGYGAVSDPQSPAASGDAAASRLDILLNSQPWGTIAFAHDGSVVMASVRAAALLGRAIPAGIGLRELFPELDQLYGPDLPAALGLQGVEMQVDDTWLWLKLGEVEGDREIGASLALIDVTQLHRALDDRIASLRFLSHDLRSPQNSIVALTQLQECDPEAFERCGGMQQIAQLARYALSLGDDFIFSSVAGGLQRDRFVRFDICAMVRDMIPKLDVVAVYRGVSLQLWQQEGTPVWINGVRVFAARALQNLVDNAIYASAPGSAVRVSLKVQDGFADIVVSDAAGGMPGLPEQGIFTDFEKLPDKAITGFGLGLKLTAQIVRLHGGTLHAESTRGVGTTFVIRFPCLVSFKSGTHPGTTLEPGALRRRSSFNDTDAALHGAAIPSNGV